MTADIRALPTHLHATVRGEFASDAACDILTRIGDAANNQPTLNVLMDMRETTGNPTLRQRFEVVTHAIQMRINSLLHGGRGKFRTAIVGHAPLVHPNGYGARLLNEHNMKVAIFDTPEAAYAWLGISDHDTASARTATDQPGAPA